MTDQHWFDALAVTLARGISRKQLLKLAGGAALSLMAPRLPALAQQARCRTGADCPAGTPDCCAGQCTSLQIDDTSCGVCGNNCLAGGRICENGVCVVSCSPPKLRSGDSCVCPAPTTACRDDCCAPGQQCCPSGVCCAPDQQCCGGLYCCALGETCCGGSCCNPAQQVCFPNGDLLNGTRCCDNDRACGDVCCGGIQECVNGSCEKSCFSCAQDETCCRVGGNAFCKAVADLCGGQCCSPYVECASSRSDPNARVCCPAERHVCNGVCCDADESCADDDGRCIAAPATLCRPPCDADSRCCGGSSSSDTSQCCACCTVEKDECGRWQLLGFTLPDGSPERQCIAAEQLCPELACGPGQSCCSGTSGTRHQCCGDDQACCDGRCCQPGDVCNAGQCVSLCPDSPCAPGQSCCRSTTGMQQQCCGPDQACCDGRCCKPDEECKAGQCVPKSEEWEGTWHAVGTHDAQLYGAGGANRHQETLDAMFTFRVAADGTIDGEGRATVEEPPGFGNGCAFTRSPQRFEVPVRITGKRSATVDGQPLFTLELKPDSVSVTYTSACGTGMGTDVGAVDAWPRSAESQCGWQVTLLAQDPSTRDEETLHACGPNNLTQITVTIRRAHA
jgi:hypothetical protein